MAPRSPDILIKDIIRLMESHFTYCYAYNLRDHNRFAYVDLLTQALLSGLLLKTWVSSMMT